MSFKTIVVSSILIGLFVVSFFSFAIMFSSENSTTSINDNPAIRRAFGNISQVLNESKEKADEERRAYIEETSDPGIIDAGLFVIRSSLHAFNTFMDFSINLFTYFFLLIEETIGISAIVTGSIMAILIILLVLYALRLIRSGEP